MISFLFPGVEIGMRAIVSAVVAIQVGLAHPACAEIQWMATISKRDAAAI